MHQDEIWYYAAMKKILTSILRKFSSNVDLDHDVPPPAHHKTNAVKWVGLSWSYAALCEQSFQFGIAQFDEILKKYTNEKPIAVVMDVDETILSNHQYEYERVKTFTRYTDENWNEWVERANAPLIQGAKKYIEHIRAAGVKVILISNRTTEHVPETLKNLSKLGLEFNAEELLFRKETRDKTARQLAVTQQYDVIMYVGDQQGDFPEGSNTLVLPNPMYGHWDQLPLP